jgi:cytochrome c551/c552
MPRSRAVRLPVLIILLASLPPVVAAAGPTDAEALARYLLNSQGCKACHRIEEAGAKTGPNLEKVGRRLSPEQMRATLVNPQKRHADGRIGDFSYLQDHEIEALVLFLSTRK